ncbi:glutathione S-transferase family protein [Pseudomonas sp. A-1]|uniref:glutathione S-transferase family protein n=1 Tax=Pseudomonas sp. A-1 TaxID=1821274 RepID=UPI0010A6492C|nr:glutathione S-transferase family protein [Pseudomonas sp. A-1]THG81885.1 glutathione S-transferase family protein [Pseudomonas sp. A-1]
MSLILYGATLSPFVRKVRLLLAEKGLDYQLEIVAPFNQPDWFMEISPLGRIPALRDGELTLADSGVIAQYIEEQYPEAPALYGRDAVERARIRWLEKYADYELSPLTTFCVFLNRALNPTMGKPCNEEAVQKALAEKLPRHFDYLEKALGGADYFVGDRLSVADLAFACQIANLQHGGESIDAARWPGLAALYVRLCQRASLQGVLPDECTLLAKLLARAQNATPA